jgi:hypothetical protein
VTRRLLPTITTTTNVHGSMATTRPAICDDDEDLDVEEATV